MANDGLGGFHSGLYEFSSAGGIVRLLILFLAVTLFIHLAAKMVLDKSEIIEALGSAVLGVLAMFLVVHVINVAWLGKLLGLAAFIGVIALIYKTKLLKGVTIGFVAWCLYWLTGYVLNVIREKF